MDNQGQKERNWHVGKNIHAATLAYAEIINRFEQALVYIHPKFTKQGTDEELEKKIKEIGKEIETLKSTFYTEIKAYQNNMRGLGIKTAQYEREE